MYVSRMDAKDRQGRGLYIHARLYRSFSLSLSLCMFMRPHWLPYTRLTFYTKANENVCFQHFPFERAFVETCSRYYTMINSYLWMQIRFSAVHGCVANTLIGFFFLCSIPPPFALHSRRFFTLFFFLLIIRSQVEVAKKKQPSNETW